MTECAASWSTENVPLASVTSLAPGIDSFGLCHDEVLNRILLPLLSPGSVWSCVNTEACLLPVAEVYSPVLAESHLYYHPFCRIYFRFLSHHNLAPSEFYSDMPKGSLRHYDLLPLRLTVL